MKRNLSLSKKRQIARMVLEGLHGFRYHWPERSQVIKALDDVVNSDTGMIVMLRGASGAGVSSILDEFSSKHQSGVIVVTPRLYDDKVNIIGQVLHALFPFDKDSGELRYAAKVGTGFNDKTLRTILAQLQPLETDKPSVVNPPKGADAKGVHWLQPDLLGKRRRTDMAGRLRLVSLTLGLRVKL